MEYRDGIKIYDPNKTSKNILFSRIMHNSEEISIQLPKNKIILDKEKNRSKLILPDDILNLINSLDDSIIEITSENSEKWFNKKLTIAECKSIYKNNIKDNCLSCFFDETTVFYKSKKEMFNIEDIQEEIYGIALIKCDVIVFSKSYFYTRWFINQIKIKEIKETEEPEEPLFTEYSIIDLPEHEIDEKYIKKLEEITLF
jgi:hypothetical protein